MARQEIPKNIRASLYIDGKPAQNSIKNVEQVARTLRRELSGLTIGTSEWNAKMNELKVHQRTLTNIRNEIRGTAGAFGWLKSEIGKFGTIAAGYLGFQFITNEFQNVITQNARLSDSLADIRRVAGLTENEVRKLDKSFTDLNTRTSKSGLRDIAVIAGKLGVAKNDILGFVEATDKLVVALGDELGNADQITTQLGKILNVFDGEVTGDNITRLGNAMVKLANDGVASAAFISDFAQRISGIAKTANVSLGSVVGLAAGLEELGARPESAATAIQKLLVTMAQDIPNAARIANVPVKEFTDLFGKTPEEALLRYAEGLTQNKNAFSDIAVAFKDAGEEGVRVVETITKLGERSDFMRSKFEDGKEALQGYNEIMAAFELKNETLGAKVDKLSKSFNRLTTNRQVVGFFISLVDAAISAVNWIEKNSESIKTFIKVMTLATATWTAYRIATAIATTTLITARSATIAMALAKAILTGNVKKASQALRLFNIAVKANPIGLIAAAVVAAAGAFFLFSNRLSEAERLQKRMVDAQLEAEKATVRERNAIERNQEIINDDTSSRNEKLAAITRLRNIMPNVLKNYSDEEIMAGRATAAIRNQTKAILEQAKVRAYADQITDLEKKKIDLNDQLRRGFKGATLSERASTIGNIFSSDYEKAYSESLKGRIASVDAQIKGLEEEMGGKGSRYKNPLGVNTQSNPFAPDVSTREYEMLYNPGVGGSTSDNPAGGSGSKKGKKIDQVKKDQEALREFLKKNNEDIYIDQLIGAEKELALLDQKYDKERAKAHGNKDLLKQIDEQQQQEFVNLLKKTTDETQKKSDALAVKQAEAYTRIYEAGLSEREKELYDVRQHYADLISLAEKFGMDSTALVKRQAEAEAAIKKKNKKEDEAADVASKEAWQNAAIQATEELTSSIFAIGQNRRQAELNSKVASLEREREIALQNENLTQEQRKAINDKFESRIKAEKRKAFEADKKAAISQAVIDGLVGVGKLWIKPGFPAAIPMAALLTAQTAARVAVIAAQKSPEYATGGYSDQDPAGYVSRSTLFRNSASGRSFIAGEAGREWIAPNWMVNSPKYANIIGMLESARREKRFFANGGPTDDSTTSDFAGYDFSRLEGLLVEVLSAQRQANNKKVVFEYKTFEEFKTDIEYARTSQGRK